MSNGAYANGWVGRLTDDPDVRTSSGGNIWVTLSVAVNNSTRDPKTNEWVNNATYYNLKAFGKLATNIADTQAIVKGTEICFSGQIRSESWNNKEGEKRSVQNVVMLSNLGIELSNAQVPGEIKRISGSNDQSRATATPKRAVVDSEGSDHFGETAASPWAAAGGDSDNPFG